MKNYPDYNVSRLYSFIELLKRLESFNDRTAFIWNEEVITYKRFLADVYKVAAYFNKYDRRFILVNSINKYFYVLGYFASIISNNIACLQPINLPLLKCFTKLDFAFTASDEGIANILKDEDKEFILKDLNLDDLSTVLCSSGTTSDPKAVGLSQTNIISDLIAGMEKYTFNDNGRFVSILPYSHSFGVVCDLLGPLYSGSSIYLCNIPTDFFLALPKHNPTALNVIPSVVDALIDLFGRVPSKEMIVGTSLKKILSGGAGTPRVLCEKMAKYDIAVMGCYGLSECAPCVSVNRDEANKYGSSGIALNCNKIMIEDDEIVIDGTNVMLGYLDEDGHVIPQRGNYYTGDLGYIDEEGYLYVTGRKDDLLVFSNGEMLMPLEMENLIVPIAGVKECLVSKKGDDLIAHVVLKDPSLESSVKEEINKIKFGNFQINIINFYNEHLARTKTGKINRKNYEE